MTLCFCYLFSKYDRKPIYNIFLSGGDMFTFVSDLDHTLIYSHQKEGSCVEVLNGCGLTYMTPAAKQIFYRLLNQKDFYLFRVQPEIFSKRAV